MPNPTNRNTIARSRPRRRTAALLLVGPMLAAAGCAAEKPVPDVHLPALAWRPAVIEAVPGATLRVGVSLEGEPIAEDLAFRFESSSPRLAEPPRRAVIEAGEIEGRVDGRLWVKNVAIPPGKFARATIHPVYLDPEHGPVELEGQRLYVRNRLIKSVTVEPNTLKRVGGTTTLTVEFEDYPTVDPFPQRRPIIDPSTGATGRDLPALEIVEIEPRPGLETRGLAPARRYRVTVGPVMNVPLYVELRANYGGDSLSALLRLE